MHRRCSFRPDDDSHQALSEPDLLFTFPAAFQERLGRFLECLQ